jgi:hypothetical protein
MIYFINDKLMHMKIKFLFILLLVILYFILYFTAVIIIDRATNHGLESYRGIIQINDRKFYKFRDNFDFNKIDLYIYNNAKSPAMFKVTEHDQLKIRTIWEFIKESYDPYIRKRDSYDIEIFIHFYKSNEYLYTVEISKNYRNDLVYFIFSVPDNPQGNTYFSCYDNEGVLNEWLKNY